MIASLPMYARAENLAAHNTLWALIRDGLRAHGVAAPENLDQDAPVFDTWARPDLVLGQICNLPLRARLLDRVTIIGTLDYGLPDVAPGQYRSVILSNSPIAPRPDQPIRLAYNEGLSRSGWANALDWFEGHHLTLGSAIQSGSHRNSARLVAEGAADLAALDEITWRQMQRWDRSLTDGLHVLGHSAPGPGMTLITRQGQDPAPYTQAAAAAITALPDTVGQTLGLRGLVQVSPATFRSLSVPKDPASVLPIP